jgi:hypothetical protein
MRHPSDGYGVAVAGLEDERLGRVEDLVAQPVAFTSLGSMRAVFVVGEVAMSTVLVGTSQDRLSARWVLSSAVRPTGQVDERVRRALR